LPVAAPADLGETESVSEDELPPDSDKKKKGGTKLSKTPEKKIKTESGSESYFYDFINFYSLKLIFIEDYTFLVFFFFS